jgi:membrane fusion protein (multidrug efflux system)
MTNRKRENEPTALTRKRWLIYFWGSLPAIFFFSLLAVIVLFAFQVRTQRAAIEKQKAEDIRQTSSEINVITMEARPMPIRDRINLPGQTAPWVRLQVMSEARGKVMQKIVTEGRRVQVGDLLAVLDKRDYKIALASAKASYDVALADWKRIEELYGDQLATRSQYDNAQAQVETLQAAMESAALNQERCTILSPISGVVNRVDIEQGQYLKVGDLVAEVLQMDPIKVVVGIPESDVDAVRDIKQFSFQIDALGDKTFQGRKHFLSRTADSSARIFNLEIKVENPAGEILPDMFARVDIVKKEAPDALSVPIYAVVTREGEQMIFVENDGRAYRKKVSLGLQEGWRVQITEGLAPHEQVIVVGHREVNDGQPVKVIRRVFDPEEIGR